MYTVFEILLSDLSHFLAVVPCEMDTVWRKEEIRLFCSKFPDMISEWGNSLRWASKGIGDIFVTCFQNNIDALDSGKGEAAALSFFLFLSEIRHVALDHIYFLVKKKKTNVNLLSAYGNSTKALCFFRLWFSIRSQYQSWNVTLMSA